MSSESLTNSTRQERRERKLRSQRQRMKKHGKNIGKVYLNAIRKRMRGK